MSVSLGTTKVYGMVLEKFCTAPLPSCNTLTPIVNDTYPVYVDGNNSGVDALVCALCALENAERVIDNDLSNYASITLTAGVATSAQFAVANALDTYPVNSFAGFDIETNSILSAAVISNASISLYNNGSLVQTSSGNALIVGATSSLLSGTSRQTVGIVANVAYDEVKISFNQLVGANLGVIKIYSAVLEKTCSPSLFCNSTYYLNSPNFPSVINTTRSGISGVVSALANIDDIWNVVSNSTTDYARITNTAAVAASASISVLDPLSSYPSGTFAGYVIHTASSPLVLLDLFNAITVTTYLDGVLQESKTGSNLIDLTVLATLIGTPSGATYNVGFETSLAFDEIQISVSSLVSVGLLGNAVDVYGAFIDTRKSTYSASLTCMRLSPDINATFVGVSTSGSVHTNDIVPTGTTYGTAVADASNPASTIPTISSDGSYTFSTSVAGTYIFNVPVCATASVNPCPTEMLTINVLDNSVGAKNPPVANTDHTISQYNTPVDIVALANDNIGTPGSKLDTSSMVIIDLNGASAGNTKKGGTASVNTTTGIISYTPPTGFSGKDTIQYTVCDNQAPAMCTNAYIVVMTLAPSSINMTNAADDYYQTNQGLAISNNVGVNDFDPEGNTQTVQAKSVTVPGQYSFVLASDGSFTFTPDATFTGPVSFDYTTCDDGTPPECANATFYMLVAPLSFPLPLTLQSFDVVAEKCTAHLSWTTLSEKNLSYFSIQYSNDGINWQEMQKIAAQGSARNYSITHQPDMPKAYYRLQMHYLNEQNVFYSESIAAIFDCKEASIRIYPNPVTDYLTIDMNKNETEIEILIINTMGQVVYMNKSSKIHNKIPIKHLTPGIYTVKVNTEEDQLTQSIQIK